jgi:hypothetical protein
MKIMSLDFSVCVPTGILVFELPPESPKKLCLKHHAFSSLILQTPPNFSYNPVPAGID